MRVRRAGDALDVHRVTIRKRGAKLTFDNSAPDLERRKAKPTDPRADATGTREAEPFDRRDRPPQRRVFGTMCERRLRDCRNRGHVVAHFVLSPAAFTACSNPSTVAVSGKSRWTRVRPAFPIATRFSSPERNEATADAVYDASP